jgi:hypothetical protein
MKIMVDMRFLPAYNDSPFGEKISQVMERADE